MSVLTSLRSHCLPHTYTVLFDIWARKAAVYSAQRDLAYRFLNAFNADDFLNLTGFA
jgi:hypothetical protein